MAKLVGHVLTVVGDTNAVDGPSTDTGANGLGQRNPTGARTFDDAGNEYIYLAGVASLVAADFVQFENVTAVAVTVVGVTRLPTAATAGAVAVAMAAPVATTSFGWFQIYGLVASANIATDAAADGKVLSAGSAVGRVATGATTTKVIWGATAVGASAANLGKCFLSYPFELGTATV